MISKIERSIKPITIVTAECLKESACIVELASADHYKLEIKAVLRNGDSLHANSVDEIFEISNKSFNPIEEIVMNCGPYGRRYISISLGSRWPNDHGARIKAQGDPEFTNICSDRFHKIFDKERRISDWIPSASSLQITFFILLIAFCFIVNTNKLHYMMSKNSFSELALAVTAFTAGLVFLISLPISFLKSKIFSNAVFY